MSEFSCSICCEIFIKTDHIYSTSCGHVFHFVCMQQWQSRSRSCPECRSYNPTSHKLFLNLGEPKEDREKLQLKTQLTNMIEKTSELNHQLEQSEKNFLYSQMELTKCEEEIQMLKTEINNLQKINGEQCFEVECKKKEIAVLQDSNEKYSKSLQGEGIMSEKIKKLESKLKIVSAELDNEVKRSTEETMEKLKLQSILTQITGNLRDANVRPPNNSIINSIPKQENTISTVKESSLVVENHDSADNQTSKCNITKVTVRGIPNCYCEMSHILIILKLSNQMGLGYTEDDIIAVSTLVEKFLKKENNNEKLSLVVTFSSLDKKVKFLTNKDKLKEKEDTKEIIVLDFVSDHTNTLYHYAKVLKRVGYVAVYYRNDCVFVKKDSTSVPQKIYNARQVDDMVKNSIKLLKE